MDGGDMITVENIKFELAGRLQVVPTGKSHISVRYEPGPRIAGAWQKPSLQTMLQPGPALHRKE